MNTLLDGSLVGLALLASVGYAVSSLGPRTLRVRLLAAASRLLALAPAYLKLGRVARRLAAAAIVKPSGACGGCDNCGTESAAAPHSAAAEVKVPVANIGRREIETPVVARRRAATRR
jgi:hypothetical protein